MQINLEIYPHDFDREPIANVICNAVPRVGERFRLLAGETPEAGLYRVLAVEHQLDPRRVETVQHVCLIVLREQE